MTAHDRQGPPFHQRRGVGDEGLSRGNLGFATKHAQEAVEGVAVAVRVASPLQRLRLEKRYDVTVEAQTRVAKSPLMNDRCRAAVGCRRRRSVADARTRGR